MARHAPELPAEWVEERADRRRVDNTTSNYRVAARRVHGVEPGGVVALTDAEAEVLLASGNVRRITRTHKDVQHNADVEPGRSPDTEKE